MDFYRNEPESPGTCSTSPAFVPPPGDEPDVASGHGSPVSPRRHGECAAYAHGMARRVIIPFIQTQMLFLARCGPGLGHNDGLRGAFQQFGIMHVRSIDHHAQRTAVGFDHHTAFYAVFAAIRWVLAHLIPPKRALLIAASALCHCQSTPPSLSHARVSFFQIFKKTPLRTQR